jgi:hypothetical protein
MQKKQHKTWITASRIGRLFKEIHVLSVFLSSLRKFLEHAAFII